MALYVIGDTHLSLGADKPMDVFGGGWTGYVEKLREGFSNINAEDTVVLCGDLSWGMSLEQARQDFAFLDALPGRKILLKGNHDYWWTTAAKMERFFAQNGFTTLEILHNNCCLYGELALCGRSTAFSTTRPCTRDTAASPSSTFCRPTECAAATTAISTAAATAWPSPAWSGG